MARLKANSTARRGKHQEGSDASGLSFYAQALILAEGKTPFIVRTGVERASLRREDTQET